MAEPSEAQLRKLWRYGVPLSKAWFTYAPPDPKSRWNDLAKQSAIAATTDAAAALGQQEMPAHEKLQRILAPAQAILTARTTQQREMQATILRAIEAGHLFGYGFEPPRKLSSVPVALPKAVWSGRLDWDKNTVTHAGLSFIEVHLTTSRYRTEILAADQPAPLPIAKPVKPGRPTVGPDIEEAFHALHRAGEIDPSGSASSHYDKVRTWLALNKPELPANAQDLGQEVIRKNFMPLFKAMKKNHKL